MFTKKIDASTLEIIDKEVLIDTKRLVKDIRVYIGHSEFEQKRLTDEHRKLLHETKDRIANTNNPQVWLRATAELMKGSLPPIAPAFELILSNPSKSNGSINQR